ncbi:MAG: serine hydrolase domain-containing protein [Myxococcota bacterium]
MTTVHGTCDPRFETVRRIFAERIASKQEVGAAIAFTLDGELVVDLWGGHADRQRTRPWERDTIVNTYSTTKGMTTICAHRLVEQGRLDLDAPVARYWPEFAQAGKQDIPVRWLLSHRAGLPAIRKPMPAESLYDWDAMVAALAETAPWWTPGTQHGYSPVTFGHLVGEVIRRIDGRTVGRMFREEIARPLEADFHIGLDARDDARVADMIGGLAPARAEGEPEASTPKPRLKGPFARFMQDMTDPTTMVGAAFNNPPIPRGGVNQRAWRGAEIPAANGHGTARALARIYGALARGGAIDGVRLLEPDTIASATEEQAAGPDATLAGMPIRYGVGFMLRSESMPFSPSPRAFGHPGAGGSLGMADPDRRIGFGFVMNKMGAALTGGQTGYAVIDAFYRSLGD